MSDRVELPAAVKTAVVQALACFDTPSEVVRLARDEHGLTLSRQAVERYDPTKRAGATLSPGLRAIFDATRAAFLRQAALVPLAHRSVRLRRLQRLADRAEDAGNLMLAANLLEQVAKEVGGAFNSRRAVAGETRAQAVVTWTPTAGQGA